MLKPGLPGLLGFIALLILPAFGIMVALQDARIKTYFPASVTNPDLVCGPRNWRHDAWSMPRYFRALSDTNEPSLYLASKTAEGRRQRTFRFAVIRRAAAPSIVRLEQQADGRMRLTATYQAKAMKVTTRLLTSEEQTRFEHALAAAKNLKLPPYSCRMGVDGGSYYYEANDHGAYRYVDRWIPPPGPLFDLGNTMFGLGKFPGRPLYPGYSTPGGDD